MATDLPIISEIEQLKSQKRFKEARKKLEWAISRYPSRYELYEELADVYIFEWEYDKAGLALDYSEKLEKGSATGMYLRWYMALVQNDFRTAIVYLEISNQKNPNNPEVLRNLGWAYTMVGEVRKWIALLERAHIIAPEDSLIIEDLGVALLAQGKIQEAREYLKQVGKEKRISDLWFTE